MTLDSPSGPPVKLIMTAHVVAYIDPGSGSFLLQILIAGIVGCIAYFRRFFLVLLGRGGRKEDPAAPAAGDGVNETSDAEVSTHTK